MRKILALLAVAVLGLSTAGIAVASAAAPEPAKAYGVCASKANGDLRILERNRLPKSVHGKCKATERRITLPSVTGLAPSKLVLRRATETETCSRVTAATTAAVWTFSCVTTPAATPSPTAPPAPSPSPTLPPSPTVPATPPPAAS